MMNKNNYSAIREENVPEGTAGGSYYQEEPNPSTSIWSACFPCFQSRQDQQVEANSLLHNSSSTSTSWMVEKLKELKEYSEVVAGPKYKNFVRKIGKYCSNPNKPSSKMQFHYDSHSYALNFDDNDDDNVDADDGLLRNFSTRFAAPFPASSAPNSNNNNNDDASL